MTVLFLTAISNAAWELTSVFTSGADKNIEFDKLPTYVHNGYVFMATQQGLLWSADTGKTWNSNKPITTMVIKRMVGVGDTLFAATGSGVQFTLDHGKTWTASNSGLTNKDVRGLVWYEHVFFAATWGAGVFRSKDNCNTWTAVNTGQPDNNTYCLTAGKGFIFLGTSSKGVYRSADFGDHWTAINNNFNGSGAEMISFADTMLYADPFDHKGVIRSYNCGEKWNTELGMTFYQPPYPHGMDVCGKNFVWVYDMTQYGGVELANDAGGWIHLSPDKTLMRPKTVGAGLGYLFVGSSNFSIARRKLSEMPFAPIPTSVQEKQQIPKSTQQQSGLHRAIRINNGAVLEFNSVGDERGALSIFNPSGSLIKQVPYSRGPEIHRVVFGNISSGLFLYRLQVSGGTGNFVRSGAVVLP